MERKKHQVNVHTNNKDHEKTQQEVVISKSRRERTRNPKYTDTP
jgi:hypothetical protein